MFLSASKAIHSIENFGPSSSKKELLMPSIENFKSTMTIPKFEIRLGPGPRQCF